ncbi:MAG: hypothetical protein RMZ69_14890 [Nostoc sp. ChiQUE01a]|nr:hypothetical protein [Nostoc sp. ChiQUE01a]
MLFSNSKPSLKISPKNQTYSFLATKNNIILIGYLITLPIFTLITLSLLLPLLSVFTTNLSTSAGNLYHSTSIPWIDDASECEHTGRDWRDRKCWDNEHSPMF